MISKIEKTFPLVIIVVSALAIFSPELFLWIKPHIPMFLGIVMFSIGLTLETGDFVKVFSLRWQIAALAILKYLIMPILAYLIAVVFGLSQTDFMGLIIISACPGGTAAAVMSYLSKSNVVLTVVLTLLTTLLSPIVTPIIIYVFLHKYVPIPLTQIASTIFWIVLFPLFDGLVLRRLLGKKVEAIKPVLPLVSMTAITLLIACIVAMNHQNILALPFLAGFAVLTDNLLGLTIGYSIAKKLFGFNAKNCRSVAFEFGILDTGMAVVLATKFFGVATALCGALFSAIQNVTGACLVRVLQSDSQHLNIRRKDHEATQ
ncbi:MAG TPA: bile acid:sodium symporter family protein [Gammaproteobacteria bacterium]|nr:bile acid:sodium symporter family protein [Gammaproteobacteria bacterium]